MKLATFASSLRPAAALLALVVLIGWAEQTAALPFHKVLSPPLHDEKTYETVRKVSKQVSRQKAAGRERSLPSVTCWRVFGVFSHILVVSSGSAGSGRPQRQTDAQRQHY